MRRLCRTGRCRGRGGGALVLQPSKTETQELLFDARNVRRPPRQSQHDALCTVLPSDAGRPAQCISSACTVPSSVCTISSLLLFLANVYSSSGKAACISAAVGESAVRHVEVQESCRAAVSHAGERTGYAAGRTWFVRYDEPRDGWPYLGIPGPFMHPPFWVSRSAVFLPSFTSPFANAVPMTTIPTAEPPPPEHAAPPTRSARHIPDSLSDLAAALVDAGIRAIEWGDGLSAFLGTPKCVFVSLSHSCD